MIIYYSSPINPDIGGKDDGSTIIKMLSMKEFTNNHSVRLDKLRKNLITMTPKDFVEPDKIKFGNEYAGYAFIPQLNINRSVRKEMGLDHNQRDVQAGIIRTDNRNHHKIDHIHHCVYLEIGYLSQVDHLQEMFLRDTIVSK